MKSSKNRTIRPFAPETQGKPIKTLSFQKNRLGIEPVTFLHQKPERVPSAPEVFEKVV